MNRLLVLASVGLACRAPAAENPPSSPPGGQDTVVIAGHALYVPRGFTVNLFAEGLNGVRYLALGPGGAVYASLPSGGQIVRLVDANRDGVADAPAQVLLSGLTAPFGITFRGDTMYFAEETTVKRLDPGAATPLSLVSGLPSGGHATRTVVIGPDNLMYVAVGSSCNECVELAGDSMRAAVTRFNLDASGGRIAARGLRNSVGLAFHPTTELRSPRAKMRPPDPSRLKRVTAARIESPASSTHSLQDEPTATYMRLSGPMTTVRVPWPPLGRPDTKESGVAAPGSSRFTVVSSAKYMVSPRNVMPKGALSPLSTTCAGASATPSRFASTSRTIWPPLGNEAYTAPPGPSAR